MCFERDTEPSSQYDDLRRRFVALVEQLTDAESARKVPATPAWTVHDVLAHVVGITADLNAGRFGEGQSPDEWTAAQVESRAGNSVAQLAAEWEREAPQFVDGLELFGYSFGAHYVGDLLQHFADVAHAVERHAPSDDRSLSVALDFYLESFDVDMCAAGVGRVVVNSGPERHECGSGAIRAEVTGAPYEMFRALGGRRSAAQIRDLDWVGDRESVLPFVSRYPLPIADVIERVG